MVTWPVSQLHCDEASSSSIGYSHRFTARFLEELIDGAWTTEGPGSPHKLLNAYVSAYTRFTPIDGCEETLATEPDVMPPKVQAFAWNKIAQG
jgi:hypothetical protein